MREREREERGERETSAQKCDSCYANKLEVKQVTSKR
jgi:hypothetical protein